MWQEVCNAISILYLQVEHFVSWFALERGQDHTVAADSEVRQLCGPSTYEISEVAQF